MITLKKIEGRIRYTNQDKKYLRILKPYNSDQWNIKDENMIRLKKHIKLSLEVLQEKKCAYCGLPLYETSGSQIEHIAPKGGSIRRKYPQFLLTTMNLVLACSYCNGFSKKGNTDTLNMLNMIYNKCEFNIVHPYFDEPKDHFNWTVGGNNIFVSYLTDKGKNSIKVFGLDDEAHTQARAKQAIYEHLLVSQPHKMEEILKEALSYRP